MGSKYLDSLPNASMRIVDSSRRGEPRCAEGTVLGSATSEPSARNPAFQVLLQHPMRRILYCA